MPMLVPVSPLCKERMVRTVPKMEPPVSRRNLAHCLHIQGTWLAARAGRDRLSKMRVAFFVDGLNPIANAGCGCGGL
jgi:hypothetical protein